MYAQVKNNEIIRLNVELPLLLDDGWVGIDAKHPEIFPIIGQEPQYNPETEQLQGPTYEFDGEKVNRKYTITPIPQEILNNRIKDQINQIEQKQGRALREAILGNPTYLTEIHTKIEELRGKLINTQYVAAAPKKKSKKKTP